MAVAVELTVSMTGNVITAEITRSMVPSVRQRGNRMLP